MSRSLHEDARRILLAWMAPDPGQASLRDAYLAHLDEHPDGMWRTCREGHLTASVMLFDESVAHVLLTLHPKHQRWLQLGGHCEDVDGTLAAAALREAVEEGGIADVTIDPDPVRLDRHPSRCYPPPGSWHLDVQFAGTVPDGSVPVISDESTDLRWWPVDGLPDDADDTVRLLVAAAAARLASGH